MLSDLRANRRVQLILGLAAGIAFGFLLQRGGVTDYDVIVGQLLLDDHTVLKIMLTAILVGMPGVYALKGLGLARLHPKTGSVGASVVGGLLFGVGFAVLGYCPGTVSGAVGQGSLDALFGGVVGILVGSWLFAVCYPRLVKPILARGSFGDLTIPQLLHVNDWIVIVPAMVLIGIALLGLDRTGL